MNFRDILGTKVFTDGKFKMPNCIFIALIHPIQWTNAYSVGADRPAKRQKKTSCVSTGLPVRSTNALARWRVVLPSCIDSVTL